MNAVSPIRRMDTKFNDPRRDRDYRVHVVQEPDDRAVQSGTVNDGSGTAKGGNGCGQIIDQTA